LPEPLFNCLSELLGLFDMKAYILRNALVNILANFVIKKLSNLDNVEDPNQRNKYEEQKTKILLSLLWRIYDEAAMGRKEVIEVFTLLVTKNVIHITIYKPLLIKVIERLRDKS